MYIEDYIQRFLFLESVQVVGLSIRAGSVGRVEGRWVFIYNSVLGYVGQTIHSPQDICFAYLGHWGKATLFDLLEAGYIKWLSKSDPEWHYPKLHGDLEDEQDY